MTARPEDLAAEIIADSGRRGSGFLVAPGIVLTALHVVLGDRPVGTVASFPGAKLRFNGDLLAGSRRSEPLWRQADNAGRLRDLGLPWHPAKLVWPTSAQLALRHDIALLALEDVQATALEPIAGLAAHAPGARLLGCRGEGYPAFRMERPGDVEIWECEYLEGELLTSRRRQDDTLAVRVDTSTPDDPDGWQGMSGAAIWIDSELRTELVGVAHTRAGALTGNGEIRCWPIADIEDPAFWQLSGIARPAVAGPRPVEAAGEPLKARLSSAFYRFDRGRATSHLRKWLRGDSPGQPPLLGRSGPPRRPAIILVTGHQYDEPILCAERFAELFATEAFPERSGAYRSPIVLSCGVADDPADIRLDDLFRQWARNYVGPVHALRPDFKSLLLPGLAARDRSRLIVVEHRDVSFGEECGKVIAGLAELLASWSPTEHDGCPPIVLVNGIIGSSAGPEESGFLPLEAYAEKEAAMRTLLARLRDSTPAQGGLGAVEWYVDLPVLSRPAAALTDVRDWLEELEADRAISIPAGLRSGIETELRQLDEFPVRFARRAVDEAIRKQEISR
ncbi:MAG TPA: hypothetical protein VFQ67_13670 [Allosphingosinicella sp.]|jgi:hypothetical protein|nr:hypothetical protein [Allosphingosinicella sp.]